MVNSLQTITIEEEPALAEDRTTMPVIKVMFFYSILCYVIAMPVAFSKPLTAQSLVSRTLFEDAFENVWVKGKMHVPCTHAAFIPFPA